MLLSSLLKAKSCIGKDNIKDVGDSHDVGGGLIGWVQPGESWLGARTSTHSASRTRPR